VSTEANKAIVRRQVELFQEFWRTGNGDVLDEVIAPEFVNHTPGIPADLAGLKAAMPMFRAAFPDLRIEAEDVVAEGDKVTLRLVNRGTHQGDLMGIPPTGRPIEVSEIHIYRVASGKIVERWGVWDQMGLMQQIGAVPAASQAAASP
jgi:predicted ester cyclase